MAAFSPPGVGVKMTRRSVALSAVRIWRSSVLSPTSWLSGDLPAPARPDRHRSLHQHPSDRLIRHAQVLTQVVQRPSVLVEDDSFVNLRIGHHRPRLAPTGNVPGDRRAMEVVDLRQLAETSTCRVLRDQRLHQAPDGQFDLPREMWSWVVGVSWLGGTNRCPAATRRRSVVR